jgi:hypothetical protein
VGRGTGNSRLGQQANQGGDGDRADARHRGQKTGTLAQEGVGLEAVLDLAFELVDRLSEPAEMRLERCPDEQLVGAPGPVALGQDQLRELAPAQHQRGQRLFGRRARAPDLVAAAAVRWYSASA